MVITELQKIRSDFPILEQKIYNKPLVYLDNAATTQKPRCVLDTLNQVYMQYNANVHRGVHYLSSKATDMMEQARHTVKNFIGAAHHHEIIFTRGTTESINLVAFSFGERFISPGDEIVISHMEHHSNFVPWQLLCKRKNAVLKVIPVTDNGDLDMEAYQQLLTNKTKMVAVTWVSNSLGTINPVEQIISMAHQKAIPVLIDAAQAVQHIPVNVSQLDCDFLAFSGHKVYGPTGIGVLYGKEYWLNQLPPYQSGGEMIHTVGIENTTFNELPFKFEAGTPDYTGIIGLAAALEYISAIGIDKIAAWENKLVSEAVDLLNHISSVRLIGNPVNRASVVSFTADGIHPYDMGMLLDKMGIAVRTGNHCTMPLMNRFGIQGTVRASFAFYNTVEEVQILAESIKTIINMLK